MPRADRLIALGVALVLTALIALTGAAVPAQACTISTAGVAFGAYTAPGGSVLDGAGTLNLSCPKAVTAPVVALSAGGSGSYAARRMTSGASNLNYNLYADSARTIVWGNGTGGSVTQTLSGGTTSGSLRLFARTIYGRVPAAQNVRAGSYGDTVIITVTY